MYTEISGIQICYETRGEGNSVLLLHGWGADKAAMRPIADAIVSMGMRAILLDFPGFGESGDPNEPWGVEEYAALTQKFIDDQELRKADIVCHSFGGRIAIYLASGDPELFNRLILIDAAGIRPKRGVKWYIRTGAYKLGKQLKKIAIIDKAFNLSEKQGKAGSNDYRALKSDIMRATFVKTVNLDLTDRLERIKRPTLLIWGSNDDATPLYMGRLMERKIPDAGLVVFEGAGHFSYIDQYARFVAVLRAFLIPEIQNCEDKA